MIEQNFFISVMLGGITLALVHGLFFLLPKKGGISPLKQFAVLLIALIAIYSVLIILLIYSILIIVSLYQEFFLTPK